MAELAGKRILVVEDEYFIASDIRRALTAQKAIVVGPVGDLARGLSLTDEPIDAAVLDVNLDTAMSFPIADLLRRRSIPFTFLTGYDRWALPPRYRDVARIAKPFATRDLLEMVERLVLPATADA